jgi:predicted O-methyltransferase YrrM
MNAELIRQLAGRAPSMPVYDSPLFPPSIYYRFFELLAAEIKPKLSVELGVGGGGVSVHLAKGNPDGMVVGVEISWDRPEEINHIIKNFPNFRFQRCDSQWAAPMIYDMYGPIDILFIDTIHTYERTLLEFKTYRPFLSKDAVVCLDDVHRPGMAKAVEKLPGEKIELDDLHPRQTDAEEGDGGFLCVININNT